MNSSIFRFQVTFSILDKGKPSENIFFLTILDAIALARFMREYEGLTKNAPPLKLFQYIYKFLGRLKRAILVLQTSFMGLNRSEFNQESGPGNRTGLRPL